MICAQFTTCAVACQSAWENCGTNSPRAALAIAWAARSSASTSGGGGPVHDETGRQTTGAAASTVTFVKINQWRRVDGVEDEATIQHERAVTF